jgi:hypothetical protein
MTKAEIAKNLLEGKRCDACHYYFDGRCSAKKFAVVPTEFTCGKWKVIEEVVLQMSSYPVKTKARKLKVKWSVEKNMEILNSPSVEEEIIKLTKDEIDKMAP